MPVLVVGNRDASKSFQQHLMPRIFHSSRWRPRNLSSKRYVNFAAGLSPLLFMPWSNTGCLSDMGVYTQDRIQVDIFPVSREETIRTAER